MYFEPPVLLFAGTNAPIGENLLTQMYWGGSTHFPRSTLDTASIDRPG